MNDIASGYKATLGERMIRGIKKSFRYLFIRRLAIDPEHYRMIVDEKPSKRIFEWQKMPKGYRWF